MFGAAEIFQEAHIQFGMFSGALLIAYWLSMDSRRRRLMLSPFAGQHHEGQNATPSSRYRRRALQSRRNRIHERRSGVQEEIGAQLSDVV
jgi:hypothetical protein